MKRMNVNLRKIFCLVGMGFVVAGCQKKEGNSYQNKTIEIVSEDMTTLPNMFVPEGTEAASPMLEEESTVVPMTTEMTTTVPMPTVKETTLMPTTIEETTIYSTFTEEYTMSDEEVIDYIQKLGDKINDCTDSITDTVKKDFIKVVDFLFYGGTIGGRTLDSLSESAKEIVFNVYDTVHTYIEAKWPSWRDTISEKYENGKQKIKSWYENFRDKNQ